MDISCSEIFLEYSKKDVSILTNCPRLLRWREGLRF